MFRLDKEHIKMLDPGWWFGQIVDTSIALIIIRAELEFRIKVKHECGSCVLIVWPVYRTVTRLGRKLGNHFLRIHS